MKKVLVATSLMVLTLLVLSIPASGQEVPDVSFTILNPPKYEPLELEVGESYTFEIWVESSEPFRMAITMLDEYYPSIVFSRGDRSTNGTSALLHLTVTGKQSTAGLAAVCDWPEPGICWPEGVAPVSIAVGARFTGGGVAAERYNISILSP